MRTCYTVASWDHLSRINDDKIHCMRKAKEYGFDYWDGDRRYGFDLFELSETGFDLLISMTMIHNLCVFDCE